MSVSFAVLKDREAYNGTKGFDKTFHIRLYAGEKGSRRFVGELKLRPAEFEALAGGKAKIEAVTL